MQYVANADDMVVGTVIDKSGEHYRLDIGASHYARLGALAFEGATKRNKPNIPVIVTFCLCISLSGIFFNGS